MKKISLLCVLTGLAFTSLAQKDKSKNNTRDAWNVYQKAMEFSDFEVARTAVFQIITLEPENKAVFDSLAHLYFIAGAYDQCLKAASKTANPDGNVPLREIRAYSLRNVGDLKSAVVIFEKLNSDFNTPEYGYQTAVTQYSLKRYGEAMATISSVIANVDSKSKNVVITTDEGKSQSVSYLAAGNNLKGVIFIDMGQFDKAKEALDASINEAPDFILAKNNLETVKSKLAK